MVAVNRQCKNWNASNPSKESLSFLPSMDFEACLVAAVLILWHVASAYLGAGDVELVIVTSWQAGGQHRRQCWSWDKLGFPWFTWTEFCRIESDRFLYDLTVSSMVKHHMKCGWIIWEVTVSMVAMLNYSVQSEALASPWQDQFYHASASSCCVCYFFLLPCAVQINL